MSSRLGIPPGTGAGRARYARAMALYSQGFLSAAQLEAYRIAAADDYALPDLVFEDNGLPLPQFGNPELDAVAYIENHNPNSKIQQKSRKGE